MSGKLSGLYCLNTFLGLFVISITISIGEAVIWDDPPFELLNEFPEEQLRLETRPSTGRITLYIEENLGKELTDGFSLCKLKFTAPPTNVRVSIISSDDQISVNKTEDGDWHLITRSSFDYEVTFEEFLLEITADTEVEALFLQVVDVNDNAPEIISREPPQIPVIEELKVPDPPVLIFKINAVDKDVNDKLKFKLTENGSPSEFFRIVEETGEVFHDKALDYAQQSSHRLDIVVSDDREPYHTVSDAVTISVKDIPNRPPVFSRTPIIPPIREEMELDDRVISTVQARDGDTGVNWNIEYSLEDELDLLKIDAVTGEIRVNKRIDAESKELQDVRLSYKIKIIAREIPEGDEYPALETTEEADITIIDINDEAPQFCEETEDPEVSPKCDVEKEFSFVIDEDHSGPIQLENDDAILVTDADSTISYNTFLADFASDTEDFVKAAFTISPRQGSGQETFTISVNTSRGIDFDEGEHWHDVNGDPVEVMFTIEFTGTNDTSHKAYAKIKATVQDVNDNKPNFQLPDGKNQYEFSVCENTPNGTSLWHILPTNENYPDSCMDHQKEYEIHVAAIDKDISSDEFGQNSVVYRWSNTARSPPIILDEKLGTMKIQEGNGNGFDFERMQEEFFVVEAFDKNGEEGSLSDTAYIRFKVLDRNDMNVDLKFGQGIRATIFENTSMTAPVLDEIIAEDVDQTANVRIYMTLRNTMNFTDELKAEIEKWFKLEVVEGIGTGRVKARIILGDTLPDREGYGIMNVDRVDLIIEAEDLHNETEQQRTSQDVTIIINDVNDNEPEWPSEDENFSNQTFTVEETDEIDDDNPRQREIQRFRVVDRDRGTRFKFNLANQLGSEPDCQLEDDICKKILDIFELDSNENSGTTVLSRKQGVPIDRENKNFFPATTKDSIINLTFIASDGNYSLTSKIYIHVADINDNTPIFAEDYSKREYSVEEDAMTGALIGTILATDEDHPDKFGKVSYLIENYREGGNSSGHDSFQIGEQDGQLTPIEGKYDWFDIQELQVQIKAIDDYTQSFPGKSRSNITVIRIAVKDKNNHPPEFLTDNSVPVVKVKETEGKQNEPLDARIETQDKDDPSKPNGQFSVEIESVEKDPPLEGDPEDLKSLFELFVSPVGNPDQNIKEVKIIPTRNLIGLWGNYTITLLASDGEDSDPGQLTSSRKYVVEVLNENLHAPEFIVPEVGNEILYQLSIRDSRPEERLIDITNGLNQPIPNVYAIDKDKGSGPNGEITYSLDLYEKDPENDLVDCTDLFSIRTVEGVDNTTGMIVLCQQLGEIHSNRHCMLIIEASDKGEESKQVSKNQLQFYLAWHINTPPAFPARTTSIDMKENQTEGISVEVMHATDADIERGNLYFPDDQIYYFFKGGDYSYFDLRVEDRTENNKPRRIPIISPKEILDREERDEYRITLYATNDPNELIGEKEPDEAENEESDQWLVVLINVCDIIDTAPIFDVENDTVTAGFSEISRIDDKVPSGGILVIDPDLNDSLVIWISSNFTASDPSLPLVPPPFELQFPDDRSVEMLLKFDPKPTYRGHYTFQLSANDSAGMRADVNCRIYMVTRQNIVTFSFHNDVGFIRERQTELELIFSETFANRCNVDRLIPDTEGTRGTKQASGAITKVETHFINLANNEPISGSVIAAKRFSPDVMEPLLIKLRDNNFLLVNDGITGPQEPGSDNDPKDIIMYVLVGGVAVLIVTLLIIGATCYFNNRSLSRRVRALTATTFGSQKSDLNRAGTTMMSAPNTNEYAVEGSNPIWTVDADARRPPQFDTESIGSGGSVLIGAEDEDYFQKSSKNPMFLAEDIVANYDSGDDARDHYYSEPYQISSRGKGPAPQPPPFGTKTTKNPLVSLGGTSRNSIDVDAIDEGDEAEEDAFGYDRNDNFAMF